MGTPGWLRASVLLGLWLCSLAPAWAVGKPPTENRSSIDPAVMQIDESRHLGQKLAPGVALIDESGKPLRMAEVLGKPVILVLSYYGCDGTCPTINQNLAVALEGVKRFKAGQDYRVLTVSFDRRDDPELASKFAAGLKALSPQLRDGWRFAVLQAGQKTGKWTGMVSQHIRPDGHTHRLIRLQIAIGIYHDSRQRPALLRLQPHQCVLGQWFRVERLQALVDSAHP